MRENSRRPDDLAAAVGPTSLTKLRALSTALLQAAWAVEALEKNMLNAICREIGGNVKEWYENIDKYHIQCTPFPISLANPLKVCPAGLRGIGDYHDA